MQNDDDGRWMTYAEIADARGTERRAAVMLVRRHGWRRQRNNAGHTIALVPATWQERADTDRDRHGSGNGALHDDRHGSGHSSDNITAGALAALETALTEANTRADVAEARAVEAGSRADAALALADRLGAQLADAGERADRAHERADRIERDLSAALAVADRARADATAARD
ncbi:MAG TPA: hypothetical protein VFQ90_20010, partial [Stellaceae bacterium]|nr:hypothetical protein [Stellaceae bacterium]